jgi:hypothetical protein
MYCEGGAWSDPPPYRTEFDRSTKHTFTSETSDAGPGLWISGGTGLLAYRGSGNRNLNLLRVDLDDYSIMRKDISAQTSPYQPSILSFQNNRYIAWTGEDDNLNVGRIG